MMFAESGGPWRGVPWVCPLILAGCLAAASTFITTARSARAQVCPAPTVGGAGHWPATSDCCRQLSPPLQCASVSPGLAGGKKNVLFVVLDDHGHCQNGFMGGRCARGGSRCTGKVCSNARWIACGVPADCPPAAPGEPAVACAPADPLGCDCTHGYCRQCSDTVQCAGGELCVDGLCSPRAPCSADFQCARGIGTCQNRSCVESGAPCSANRDCNDACGTDGKCKLTPAPCGANGDCTQGDYVCTSSSRPLRLNDIACRYRHPGSQIWAYNRLAEPRAGEQTVYTPELDALAREGAVFPRARGGGEVCTPGRGALLVGKLLRHNNAVHNDLGLGARQCNTAACSGGPNLGLPCDSDAACPGAQCVVRDAPIDEPLGCAVADTPEPSCVGGWCDQLHTIAWWLRNLPHVAGESRTIAAGKVEIGPLRVTSFEVGIQNAEGNRLGRFSCGGACEHALREGKIPNLATCHEGAPCSEPERAAAAVMDPLRAPGELGTDGQLRRSFFVWYAPRLPHEPVTPPSFFASLYQGPDALLDDGERHLGRTSWFDAGLQGLIDELKRTCVCGEQEDASGQPAVESLYDNTVVIVMPDNAFLMPEAKGDSALASENAHRHALIINAPVHRVAASPRTLLDEQSQLAGHQDVLPTLLDYAGVSQADELEKYPLSRSLRELVEGGMGRGYVRNAHYGHGAPVFERLSGARPSYVVPRPGTLGLCRAGSPEAKTGAVETTGRHARPCLVGTDCGCSPLLTYPPGHCCDDGTCCQIGARRCSNRPDLLCDDDIDCAPAFCDPGSGRCRGGTSGFVDFFQRPCATDRDCVPRGVCRPPMLKVYQQLERKVRKILRAFDLNLDPDQNIDLLRPGAGDPRYLGGWTGTCPPKSAASLADKLECCMREFWTLDPADEIWRPPDCGCPAQLRAWAPVHAACPSLTPVSP